MFDFYSIYILSLLLFYFCNADSIERHLISRSTNFTVDFDGDWLFIAQLSVCQGESFSLSIYADGPTSNLTRFIGRNECCFFFFVDKLFNTNH
jgi:hypothetical protein